MVLKSPQRMLCALLLLSCAPLGASEGQRETYTDRCTALMWQDVPENRGVVLTWEEAKLECELLDLAGFDDWWLPSESELATIVDNERPRGRKIKKGFTYYKGAAYWTSSTYAWNAPHAWVIDFGIGSSYALDKQQRRFVRCVRCSDFKACLQRFYNK